MIGVAGWAVILGAWVVWEGIGLLHAHDAWPTMSDLLRAVSRPPLGRWLLFGLWLWLGWHLFIRGWRFFLSGPPPSGGHAPPGPAQSASRLLREDIMPLFVIYAGLLAALVTHGLRLMRVDASPERPPEVIMGDAPLRSWVEHAAGTAAGGYASFMLIIALYYALVAGQDHSFVEQAAGGGAFLSLVAAVFFLLTVAIERAAGRDARSHGSD